MILVPDIAVEIVRHPESTFPIQYLIDFLSCKRFPGMYDLAHASFNHFDQRVDVVWHDDPAKQTIAPGIEPQEGLLDNCGYFRIFQVATAITGIQKSFERSPTLKFLIQIREQAKSFVQCLQLSGWNRIEEAKRYALYKSRAVEMGEISSGVPIPLFMSRRSRFFLHSC